MAVTLTGLERKQANAFEKKLHQNLLVLQRDTLSSELRSSWF